MINLALELGYILIFTFFFLTSMDSSKYEHFQAE